MQLSLPAIILNQGDRQIFVTSMSYGNLLRLDREEMLYIANDVTQPDVAQRSAKPAKVRSIAVYILNRFLTGRIYFAPLLLNILPAPSLQLLGGSENVGMLMIPYSLNSKTRLIDGQHRLLGIRQAIDWLKVANWSYLLSVGVHPTVVELLQSMGESAIEALAQIQIGVQVYGGLSVKEERQAFHDTNRLLDKPDSTLCYAFDSSKPNTALARAIAEKCPWFIDNVSLFKNSFTDNPQHLVTLSALVQATTNMFPIAPDVDSDISPYVHWATCFWNAVACNLTGQPWGERTAKERKVQRNESMVAQAILFLALGKLANDLADLQVPQMIVMREPIPDAIAHVFLISFLNQFSSGKSLYQSVRAARERLQDFEEQYPCATWLPVVIQNPTEIPLTWQDWKNASD